MLREFCQSTGYEPGQVFKHDGTTSGGSQRFRDYCGINCINRRLVLIGFALGLESAKEIAQILAVKRDIVHINLAKNNFRDQGVEEIMRVVKYNPNVIHLDLMQNNLTPNGSKKVFKSLIGNSSLISLKMGNIENTQKNKIGI